MRVPARCAPHLGHRHSAAVRLPRYRLGARFYSILSAERWVYRPGRITAIDLLRLHPGARVLVLGCGTGLGLLHLQRRVGPAGQIVGVDASEWMLARAQLMVARHGWANVTLVLADAARLPRSVGDGFDAVLFSYSLAVIGDWRRAWSGALACLRSGGRVAVVDTDLPTGQWRVLGPLARLALWSGGVDRSRRVWELVDGDTASPQHATLKGGHIRVAAGVWCPTAASAP